MTPNHQIIIESISIIKNLNKKKGLYRLWLATQAYGGIFFGLS